MTRTNSWRALAALIVVPLMLALIAGTQAQGQGAPKKLKFGIGTLVMNLTYPWATMPVALGWWRQSGGRSSSAR